MSVNQVLIFLLPCLRTRVRLELLDHLLRDGLELLGGANIVVTSLERGASRLGDVVSRVHKVNVLSKLGGQAVSIGLELAALVSVGENMVLGSDEVLKVRDGGGKVQPSLALGGGDAGSINARLDQPLLDGRDGLALGGKELSYLISSVVLSVVGRVRVRAICSSC